MNPRSYSDQAIVLARKNFGEADRILSVFSKSHGRISLIAKGVRKLKSKKRGHIEVFSLINFHAIKSHGIDMITEAELQDNFENLRKSLKKISLTYYICEILGKITQEREANIELFNLLLSTLEKLKSTSELKKLRLSFIKELLIITGYWPRGVELENPDDKLEEVVERQVYSKRIGKIMSS